MSRCARSGVHGAGVHGAGVHGAVCTERVYTERVCTEQALDQEADSRPGRLLPGGCRGPPRGRRGVRCATSKAQAFTETAGSPAPQRPAAASRAGGRWKVPTDGRAPRRQALLGDPAASKPPPPSPLGEFRMGAPLPRPRWKQELPRPVGLGGGRARQRLLSSRLPPPGSGRTGRGRLVPEAGGALRPPPQPAQGPSSVLGVRGGPRSLLCFLPGHPEPEVTWYKDDQELDRYCGMPKPLLRHPHPPPGGDTALRTAPRRGQPAAGPRERYEEGRSPCSDWRPAESSGHGSQASPEPTRWRRLQPALRARRLCREHAQLWRWIFWGLLCAGPGVLARQPRGLVLASNSHGQGRECGVQRARAETPPEAASGKLQPEAVAAPSRGGHVQLEEHEEAVSTSRSSGRAQAQRVSWRAVSWGLALQFALGLFVIRTEPGFVAFQWLGDQIQVFLSYTVAGSSFVFGETLVKEVFAFQVLPIIVFFSCVMSVLYYVGLMQWVILKIAWLMQVTMGTTATETLSVAGNIFVSQVGLPGGARPGALAESGGPPREAEVAEGRSIWGGATVHIDAASLVAASVMAAPCALALSKLVYPEVEESKFKSEEGVKLSYGDAQNVLEAASTGAAVSVKVVANIAANLIAFLAVLAFINAALAWLGDMVDVQGLSFQLLCSYVLRPVAFLMGVAWEDCPVVAELLGIKLFLNEFVAYQELSQYKQRRLAGAEEWAAGRKQWISVRAETLTTFALCGFANFSSIGIMLGGLTSPRVSLRLIRKRLLPPRLGLSAPPPGRPQGGRRQAEGPAQCAARGQTETEPRGPAATAPQ
ncbi:PREDICTED: sodium/nucleoside cotransporter 1 [Condylura cristata]|uniref:sodium/nucleoside cotransporter 1 n=1 Tax=Condylura cristata TaxID=143302 RepID=UPI000642FF5D|nr:PREDICTED: sodium/nucleoside cotransporter 1 [Condylura cristata]